MYVCTCMQYGLIFLWECLLLEIQWHMKMRWIRKQMNKDNTCISVYRLISTSYIQCYTQNVIYTCNLLCALTYIHNNLHTILLKVHDLFLVWREVSELLKLASEDVIWWNLQHSKAQVDRNKLFITFCAIQCKLVVNWIIFWGGEELGKL